RDSEVAPSREVPLVVLEAREGSAVDPMVGHHGGRRPRLAGVDGTRDLDGDGPDDGALGVARHAGYRDGHRVRRARLAAAVVRATTRSVAPIVESAAGGGPV